MSRFVALLLLVTACTPRVTSIPPVPSTAFGFMGLLVGTWDVQYEKDGRSGRLEAFRVSASVVDAAFTRSGVAETEVARFVIQDPPGRWTVRFGSDLGGQPLIPESSYCPRSLGIWTPCELGDSDVYDGPSFQVVRGDSIVFWTTHAVARSMTLYRIR